MDVLINLLQLTLALSVIAVAAYCWCQQEQSKQERIDADIKARQDRADAARAIVQQFKESLSDSITDRSKVQNLCTALGYITKEEVGEFYGHLEWAIPQLLEIRSKPVIRMGSVLVIQTCLYWLGRDPQSAESTFEYWCRD